MTTSETVIALGLFNTTAPPSPEAETVIVPVYVPGARPFGLTLTLSVAFPVPELDGPMDNQLLLLESPVADQVTGKAHVPFSLKEMLWAAGAACPCATENAKLVGATVSAHGGKIVIVTVKTCGLPCTRAPELSVALMETCVV